MIDLYPNETLPLLWTIFMVVFFFLNLWVFKPTLKIIEARKGQTDTLQVEAQKLIAQNKQHIEKYEKIILEARQKAALERENIIKKARKFEAEIVSVARKEAEAMVSAMQDELKKEPYEINSLIQNMANEAVKLVGEPQRVLMKFQTIDWNTSQSLPDKDVIGLLKMMQEVDGISLAVVPYRRDFPFGELADRKKVTQLLR